MNQARSRLLLVMLVVCVWSVAGCGGGGGQGEAAAGSTLTVLAASSLTDAFGELEGIFEEQNPGTNVQVSYAASSDLLTQLQQGAPADVFASADEAKMATAVEEGLVAEPEVFARNRPVVITPADNPAGIVEFQNLPEANARLVLAEDGVTIAEYAEDVLANADAVYGGNFSQRVLDQVVSREANVRASALRVSLGEADATFVYTSDVAADIRDQVRVVEIPEEVNVLATYPIALVKASEDPELAREWVDLVLSPEGQSTLEGYGFLPAN